MSVYRVSSNKSSVNNFPTVRPTLDLDFANSKTLDPRITFTRSSGGSYTGADGLIKLAGVNEARFDHDPVTGESLGLLVEEARTNRTTYSDYSTVTLSNVSRSTTVSTTAPDGSTVFVFDANNNTSVTHRILLTNGNTGDATVPHTASFFIKIPPIGSPDQISNNDRLLFLVRWRSTSGSGTGCVFDYFHSTQTFRFTGGVNAFGSNPPATYNISTNRPYFEKFPNGWYRLVFPGAVASNTSADSFSLYDWNISETTVEQGGNCSVFLWGAQFEQGSFPTSYIPTIGSTRTRAADNAIITGKNFSEWYRQDEGTIFSEQTFNATLPNNNFGAVWSINSFPNDISMVYNPSNSAGFFIRNNNVVQVNFTSSTVNVKVPFKNIVTVKTKDFVQISNVFSPQTNTFGVLPNVVGPFTIGGTASSGPKGAQTISRLTYYPKRLPNAQLQALTK